MAPRPRHARAKLAAPARRAPARTLAVPLSRATRPAIAPLGEPVASPVIKWVGGKTKLLPALLARLPSAWGRYYEPFAGGAALFFRLAPKRAVLADRNPDLVGLYRAIAADPAAVIRRLELHRAAHDEAHYYDTRARWNDATVSWTAAERAATFIYLNKTCFNGLWRVNRAGAFNVPMGRYVDPPICVPTAVEAAHRVLGRAELRHADYRHAVADAVAGDLVYFDPPYDPVTPTASFTSYTADAFGAEQQRELADLARELVGRGVRVMLSNSDTPLIRTLYKSFRVERVKCARAINSNAAKRGEVDEVIAVAGY